MSDAPLLAAPGSVCDSCVSCLPGVFPAKLLPARRIAIRARSCCRAIRGLSNYMFYEAQRMAKVSSPFAWFRLSCAWRREEHEEVEAGMA